MKNFKSILTMFTLILLIVIVIVSFIIMFGLGIRTIPTLISGDIDIKQCLRFVVWIIVFGASVTTLSLLATNCYNDGDLIETPQDNDRDNDFDE